MLISIQKDKPVKHLQDVLKDTEFNADLFKLPL